MNAVLTVQVLFIVVRMANLSSKYVASYAHISIKPSPHS